MPYENILLEIKDRILWLTINRESKLNALNKFTLAELHYALSDAFKNPEIGGIIITGAGSKAFVAGADIAEFADLSSNGGRILAQEGHHKVMDIIHHSEKPIIAAINGFALGGGLELAMACHIRIAATNARLGLPELTLGLIPGYGGTQRLTQLVGRGRALDMILTADMISAESALGMGLVNQAVEPENLLAAAEEKMRKILSKAPVAVAAAITAVNAGLTDGVNGFEAEIDQFGRCFDTEDFKEGVSAFLEKRKADFKGK
ncbi:MAG: enoyl-CoA hydratase/isomerase family protein [Sphingobacteriaceae bacterium]